MVRSSRWGIRMNDLADALDALGECTLTRFHSNGLATTPGEAQLPFRALWAPLWRRGLGASIDRMLGSVDVVHVADAPRHQPSRYR